MIPTFQAGQIGRALGSPGITLDAAAVSLYAAFLGDARGSYWEFEENNAGTTFADSTGNGNSLTARDAGSTVATSTLHGGAGLVSRGFYVNNTTQRTAYIPRANTNLDLPNVDWTFGGWFVQNTDAGDITKWMMGRNGSTAKAYADLTLSGVTSGSAHNVFRVSTDGTALTSADSGDAHVPGEWALYVCTLDRTNNLIRLRIKSATRNRNVTAAFAGAMFSGSTNANFNISSALSGDSTFPIAGARQLYTGGTADQCFFVSKAISTAELDYLYNAGAGRTWAQLLTDSGH